MALWVALLAEGVGRNGKHNATGTVVWASPSSRRAWVEIALRDCKRHARASPSSRRAWVEIGNVDLDIAYKDCRPPRGGRG